MRTTREKDEVISSDPPLGREKGARRKNWLQWVYVAIMRIVVWNVDGSVVTVRLVNVATTAIAACWIGLIKNKCFIYINIYNHLFYIDKRTKYFFFKQKFNKIRIVVMVPIVAVLGTVMSRHLHTFPAQTFFLYNLFEFQDGIIIFSKF